MTAGWTEDRVGALKKLWLEGQSASPDRQTAGRRRHPQRRHRQGPPPGPVGPRDPVAAGAHRHHLPPGPHAHRRRRPSPSAPRRIEAAQPRPAPVVAAPSLPVVAELPGTATVMTLGAHMCKWPIGDPSSTEFSFCGRRASEGVYCVEHARVAYQPQMKRGGKEELARSLRRYI